jgi:hypothetical protein
MERECQFLFMLTHCYHLPHKTNSNMSLLLLSLQEICVEYCKNIEALCSHQHHQHVGKKQLLVQLGPNMQRLQSAMLEVQGAIAGILQLQQQLPPALLHKPQQLLKQLSADQQETQQLLIAAVHAAPAAASSVQQQQQQSGQQQNAQQQFALQGAKSKPGQLRVGYVELLNQQAGNKRYAGTGGHPTPFSKQLLQRDEAVRQLLLLQPSWVSQQLLSGLLNVSLQVAQLQELVPSVTSGNDKLIDASAAAQISPARAAADRSSSAGGVKPSETAITEELPHLVLQLISAGSAEVKLHALEALERLAAEPVNAHCMASLGVVPRLTGLLAGSGGAEQTAAAGILRHLAAGEWGCAGRPMASISCACMAWPCSCAVVLQMGKDTWNCLLLTICFEHLCSDKAIPIVVGCIAAASGQHAKCLHAACLFT